MFHIALVTHLFAYGIKARSLWNKHSDVDCDTCGHVTRVMSCNGMDQRKCVIHQALVTEIHDSYQGYKLLVHVDRKLATCCHHMWWPDTWPPGQYTCPPVSACCHISPPPTCAFFLWVSACLTILSSLMKPFPQTSHVKGFSPVCRHMWRLKSVLWLNCFGQTSHF